MDASANEVKVQRNKSEPVFVGNALKAELLRHAGIERAAALLVTMDNPQAAKSLVLLARQQWPALTILVRSRDASHADELVAAGATGVVPETLETSLQLSGHVLRSLGYPREDADACIEVIRRNNYREVRGQSE